VTTSDIEDGVIAVQSLSRAELIQMLQHHEGDDELTQMIEEEIARREIEGMAQ
jgi:hypothetical protein